MKYKRIVVLPVLVLTILSLFFSSVYAQIWDIEFSSNITPVASKVSSMIRERYLKEDYPNKVSSTPKYDDTKTDKTAGMFKILDKEGNAIKDINIAPLSISKKVGFSSVDDVMTAVTINNIGKDPNSLPVAIGSSMENVIKAMGTPESIQISLKSFKYRNSTVYFDEDWKVQSWDNRYGNLKVSLENESGDIFDIEEYIIDGIFKITYDQLNKKSTIFETDKAVETLIKEFQDLSAN